VPRSIRPGFGFFSIGGLKQNETVPVLGVSADRQFWLVNTQFGQGWLNTREVQITNEASVPGVEVGQIVTITAGQVTIRASAGIGSPRVGLASKGNQFFVVGRLPDGSWLQIKYRRGIGWIAASTTDLVGRGDSADCVRARRHGSCGGRDSAHQRSSGDRSAARHR
jgi:hypothetical protein